MKTKSRPQKKCSIPRCVHYAASARSKFCPECFVKRAASANMKRKVYGGNSKGNPGNRGNETIGRTKKAAGKKSALRRYTKMVLVGSDSIGKKDMGNQRHANDTEGHYPPGLERCWWSDRRPMSHCQIVHYRQEDAIQAFRKASHRGPEHCYLSDATCLGDIACTPLQTTVCLWPSAGSSELGEAISAVCKVCVCSCYVHVKWATMKIHHTVFIVYYVCLWYCSCHRPYAVVAVSIDLLVCL